MNRINYEINETSAGKFKVEEVTTERVTDTWDDWDELFGNRQGIDFFGRPIQRQIFEPFGFTSTYTQRRLLGTYDTLDKAKISLKGYIEEMNKSEPKPTKRIVFDQDGKEISER